MARSDTEPAGPDSATVGNAAVGNDTVGNDKVSGSIARSAAIVLIVTLTGVTGWLWMRGEERARIASQDAQVEAILRRAALLRGQAVWGQALAEIDRAKAMAVSASEAVRGAVDEELFAIKGARREIRAARRLADDNARLLAEFYEAPRPPVAALGPAGWRRLEAILGELFQRRQLDVDAGEIAAVSGVFAERFTATATATVVRLGTVIPPASRIAAVLDDWADVRHRAGQRAGVQRLVDLAIELDDDGKRRELRRQLRLRDAQAIREWAQKTRVSKLPPATAVLLGKALSFVGAELPAIQVFETSIRRYPDSFELRMAVARTLLGVDPNRSESAVRHLTAAVALRPDDLDANRLLGHALNVGVGEPARAVEVLRVAVMARPKVADLRVVLGDAYLALDNFEAAIREFRQAVQLSPDELAPLAKFGAVLMDRRKFEEAITVYRRSVKLNANSSMAHTNLARALLERRYQDEAVDQLQAALGLDDDNAAAHFELARALQRVTGRRKAALEHCRTAVRLDGGMVAGHYLLGELLDAADDLQGAISAYRKVLELAPDHRGAHSGLASAIARGGRPKAALRILDARLQTHPKDASAHYQRGVVLEMTGDLGSAIAALRAAIELQWRNFPAHYLLGQLLDREALFHEARDAFEDAVRIDGEHAAAHYRFGDLLLRLGERAEAMSEFREVLRIDADHVRAHNRLGDALFARGELKAATAAFRSVIKLRPKDADARFGLGKIYAAREDTRRAIKELRQAIELDADHHRARLLLGQLLEADGRIGRAITEFRAVIRLTPENATAHCALGNALVRRGKPAEGAVALREAVRLDAGYAEAWCSLGHAMTRLGKHQAAFEYIERGHRLGIARKKWPYPSAKWLDKARAAAKRP